MVSFLEANSPDLGDAGQPYPHPDAELLEAAAAEQRGTARNLAFRDAWVIRCTTNMKNRAIPQGFSADGP